MLLNELEKTILYLKDFFWGNCTLWLLLFVGIYVTFKLKGFQFRYLGSSLKLIFSNSKDKKSKGDLSVFAATMTSLAGSIGVGNIAGIATAVVVGGIGSLFWLWIMAAFGMATAYAETLLGNKYRRVTKDHVIGGPMVTLADKLRMPRLAACYAFLMSVASVGIGCMAQANAMVDAVNCTFSSVSKLSVGIVLAIFIGMVIIGGVKSIGKVASVLVPFKAIIYLLAGLIVIIYYIDRLPTVLYLIVYSAFNGQAAFGGFVGASMWAAIHMGVQYGIFANEAGWGSLAIAGSTAQTNHPAEQGIRAMAGVFIASMIICTITGLVIALANVQGSFDPNTGIALNGSPLVMAAFASVSNYLRLFVIIGLVLCAFTTMLAWAYYGEKALEFLTNAKISKIYRWLFTLMIIPGAILKLEFIWGLASLCSALMAIPSLISIILLVNDVKTETEVFKRKL